MNVLWWISQKSKYLKTFVATRIGKIHRASDPTQWRHVASKCNPADLATRGLKVTELVSNNMWWNGSPFSMNPPGLWPTKSVSPTCEAKKEGLKSQIQTKSFIIHCLSMDSESRLIVSKYSSWNKLCRIVAWVFRFVDNCRNTLEERKNGELIYDEIVDSEFSLIKCTQREVFGSDIKLLEIKGNCEHLQ